MSVVERSAWKCDVCGFEWLQTAGVTPEQCASAKCRSRKWNFAGGENKAGTSKVEKRKSKGSVVTERAASSSEWKPTSMCGHGYQNSFVCEKMSGGCGR